MASDHPTSAAPCDAPPAALLEDARILRTEAARPGVPPPSRLAMLRAAKVLEGCAQPVAITAASAAEGTR